jgi:acyl carrier protein
MSYYDPMQHSPQEIHSKVLEIFAQTLGVSVGDITPDMAYNSHERWDSLTHLELISNLEQAFGIDIPMEESITMTTVKKTEDLIARYVK